MRILLEHFRKFDWILVFASLGLLGLGLVFLYSSSLGRDDFSNLQKQIVFGGIGVFLMVAISFLDYRILRNDPYFVLFLYGVGVIALAGLLLPQIAEIRGVKGWYRIGPISVNPIEYMRIILVILMAKFFSLRHIEVYRIRHILLSGFYFLIPLILIFFQPDLGSVLLLGLVWLFMLIATGIKIRHLLAILGIGVLLFLVGWSSFLHEYQKARILGFLEPELDPLGIGWSQHQAKVAIGNGGIFGQGIGKGSQTQYGFLSEPHTDFIFAAIGEELGLMGIVLVFFLFCVLLWRVIRIGLQAQSNFSRLFSIGLALVLMIETTFNIGMNIGFFPIIGLPLPLVSYGGSSLIMTYIGLGILQSIKTH